LSIQSIKAATAFPTNHVIQPTLDPYISQLPPTFPAPDTNSHLVSIRVTNLLPSRCSVLGIVWAHVLGDASACNRYLRHLSHFYVNGPQAKLDIADYPSFFPHITHPAFPPHQDVLDSYDIGQVRPRDLKETVMPSYAAAAVKYEGMTINFTREEVAALKRAVLKGWTAPPTVSEQDVISAWWYSLLQRTGETAVQKMVYTVNVSPCSSLLIANEAEMSSIAAWPALIHCSL
jgi:hypothetical protein